MDDEQVEVWISMNSNEYIPPPLPVRHDDWWSKDRLDALQSGGGDLLTFEEVVTGLSFPGILRRAGKGAGDHADGNPDRLLRSSLRQARPQDHPGCRGP